jgi:hypothetical protein
MHINVTRIESHTVNVHLSGSVANPLVLGSVVAEINWDFSIVITTAGPKPEWALIGEHDSFPAYEIYINNQAIYTRPPGPTDDIGDLLPPLDVFVEDTGELQ